MKVFIRGESITICKLLKMLNIISSGGEAKFYLLNNNIKINGLAPKGKNSKIFVGSQVQVNGNLYRVLTTIA